MKHTDRLVRSGNNLFFMNVDREDSDAVFSDYDGDL